MDLQQLQAMGAIATRALVPKTIMIQYPKPLPQEQWADPAVPEYADVPEMVDETLDVHIKKRSSMDAAEAMRAPERERVFILILRCVCKPDGSQVFDTLDQVVSLKEWIWIPLAAAITEVHKGGEAKNSQPRTSSGASSRSPSAGGRSRSGKRRSPRKSERSGSRTGPSAAR